MKRRSAGHAKHGHEIAFKKNMDMKDSRVSGRCVHALPEFQSSDVGLAKLSAEQNMQRIV
jgi:hypothetical protein